MLCKNRATFSIVIFFTGIFALTFAIYYAPIIAYFIAGLFVGTFAYIIIDSIFGVEPGCSPYVLLWDKFRK